jgi:hypothetical protein
MIKIAALTAAPLAVMALVATRDAPAPPDDHHPLKRALQEARCIPVRTERMADQGSIRAYDVTCQRPPRALVVVCQGRTCRAEPAADHDRDDDEP